VSVRRTDLQPKLRTTYAHPKLILSSTLICYVTVSTDRAAATDCNVFVRVFVLCVQGNSLTAGLSLIKFCTKMFLDNRTKPREFLGHMSKFKVRGPDFPILHHLRDKQKSLLAR